MNRKQRRALGRSDVRPADGGQFAELFDAAVAQHRAGALVEAERQYRQILRLFPGSAETHSRLGAVLMAQGKAKDAIAQIERALALKSDMFEALANLSQAYLAADQMELAVRAAGRAIEIKETEPGKALLALCIKNTRFTADPNGRFRDLALRALVEGWARPRDLTGACVSLIKLSDGVNDCIAR